ncbi:MAG: hypothetical protein NT027_05400 [Proteobacteria bacterium]|nr:hypothetical protein [Pseudomonadota bacterium]
MLSKKALGLGILFSLISCKTRMSSDTGTSDLASSRQSHNFKQLLGEPLMRGVEIEMDSDHENALNGADERRHTIIINELKGALTALQSRYSKCFSMNPKSLFFLRLETGGGYFRLDGEKSRFFAVYHTASTDFHFEPEPKNIYKEPDAIERFFEVLGYCSTLKLDDLTSGQWKVLKRTNPSSVKISKINSAGLFGAKDQVQVLIEGQDTITLANKSSVELEKALNRAKANKFDVRLAVLTLPGRKPIGAFQICDGSSNQKDTCQ